MSILFAKCILFMLYAGILLVAVGVLLHKETDARSKDDVKKRG